MRIRTVMQHDERDCGAACLAMIASYYGLNISLSKCFELTKTDRTGTNIYGIVDGAGQIGMDAEPLFGTLDELKEGIDSKEISLPFVAHFSIEDLGTHFVVVFKMEGGTLLIGDPAAGLVRMKTEEFADLWTGYLITFSKNQDFRPGNYSTGSTKVLLRLMDGQWGKLAGVLFMSFIVAAIGVAGAYVFQYVIDHYSIESVGIGEAHGWLNILFPAVLALYMMSVLINYLRGRIIIKVAGIIDERLSVSFFNKVIDLPLQSLSMRQTGDYLSRYSDGGLIQQALSAGSVTLAMDAVMAVAGGIILFLQEPKLFAIAMGMVVLYVLIFTVFRKPIHISNLKNMESDAVVQSYFKESIDGIEMIKSFNSVGHVKQKSHLKIRNYIETFIRSERCALSQDAFSSAVDLAGTVLILWAGFVMVFSGSITLGSLITFYALLAYFTEPVKHIISMQPTIQAAMVAADRLNDIFELEAEESIPAGEAAPDQAGNAAAPEKAGIVAAPEQAISLPVVGKWEMDGVSFRYSNYELTLRDVSMQIDRGEIVGIVGESGSGKTTLAKLFLRFYEPEEGAILADGRDIRSFALEELRWNIAYVSQKPFVFEDTVRNNLVMGDQGITEEDMIRACRLSHADEFIEQLPMGYDTLLEEGGSNLSGGQLQRLAIARALIRHPQLLILDEATSNLDTVTENAIRDAVFELGKDMAVIIIAHRLTTIRNCDRILVMKDGEIAEQGAFEELLTGNGEFRRLWNNM